MADLNSFSAMVKRTLDALPRLQDEAIESNDYTKIDQAHAILDRLNNLGRDLAGKHGVTGPEGDMGEAGSMETPEPTAVPNMMAPVNVNTPSPMAQPAPAIMQPQAQTPAPVTINVAPQQSPAGSFQAQPEGAAPYTGRPGPAPTLMTPPSPAPNVPTGVINPLGLPQEGPSLMTPPSTVPTSPMPPAAIPFNRGKALRDEMMLTGNSEAEITKPAPVVDDVIEAGRELHGYLSNLARQNQLMGVDKDVLANTAFGDLEDVKDAAGNVIRPGLLTIVNNARPFTQDYLRDKAAQDDITKMKDRLNAAVFSKMQQSQRKPAILAKPDKGLAYVAPEITEPALLHGEPGVPNETSEAPSPTEETIKKVYDKPETALEDAKKVIKDNDPDYLEEFNKRVRNEIGDAPQLNFLSVIGLILGGLAGSPTALNVWMHRVDSYNRAKEKIGSEIYGAGKQAKMVASQEKRAAAREEAAGKRQGEREEASSKRLDKTLASQEKRAIARDELSRARLDLDRSRARVQEEVQRGNMALKPILAEMDAASRMSSAYVPAEQQLEAINRVLSKIPSGAGSSQDFNTMAQALYAKGAQLAQTKPEIATQFAILDNELRVAKAMSGPQRDTTIKSVLDRMRVLVGE